jgi:hypothetical protein
MKTRFGLFCLFLICIITLPRVANPQSYPSYQADIEGSRRNSSLIVAELRPKLFGNLPPSEAAIYASVRFDVSPEDKIMNAYAFKDSGVRRITLTEAIGRAIELNVDALLMEQLYHKDNFMGEYMLYICTRYARNNDRYAQGLSPEHIASPYERAHWSDKDFDEFYADKDINSARGKLVGGAFAFLLAHEMGHHVLGHVDHPTTDKEVRRSMEAAADAWAIDLLVTKNVSPVSGIVPMLFFYYTTRHPVASEVYKDHPADVRRMLAMYEGAHARLPSFRASIEASGQKYEDVHKGISQAMVLIKQEIKEDE